MTTRGDIEDRVGVSRLERLHARRSALVAECAPLDALFSGTEGAWIARRKILLAHCKTLLRDQYAMTKVTDGRIEDEAHCHPLYRAFVDEVLTKRAQWTILRDQIASINERIRRDDALIYYAKSEPK